MARYVPKDQSLCPKCGRMYCEGSWGEGVCTADMTFSSEPTSRGDDIAEYLRRWYELNRESWWDRHRAMADRNGVHADEFMLSFINELRRIDAACAKSMTAMNRRNVIAGIVASTAAPAKAEDAETVLFRDAMERIALLDEADGHELTREHALRAVGIASQTLGKHPSLIFQERQARRKRT